VTTIYELRRQSATLIFNVEDRYARERGVRGRHPCPIGPLRFWVIGQMVNGVRQSLTPPWEIIMRRNDSGYHLFFGDVRWPDGTLHQNGLPSATYVVRVESDYYQPREFTDIQLPTPHRAYDFGLLPGYAYPFPPESTLPGGRGPTLLRGSLYRQDGTGISDATVEVVGQSNTYLTNDSGQWVLVFPETQPAGNVTVRIMCANGSVESVSNVPIVPGRETSLMLTVLRGWVLTNSGAPIRGATVEVVGLPGQTGTNGDGSWFYYFGFNQSAGVINVTARHPDGRRLTQTNVLVQPRATVVVDSFRFA
jgi:hypothetical protein